VKRVRRKSDLRAEGLLLLTVVIWSVNYPVAKAAIAHVHFLVFNGVRFSIAAIALGLAFGITSRWKPVAAGDWGRMVRAALVVQVISQIAFMGGLSLTSAGNAAILLGTGPLWTMIISVRMHRERVGAKRFAGMICSLCGVVFVILGRGTLVEFNAGGILGDVVCLLAAFFWGAGTNLQKPLVGLYSPFQVNVVMVALGSVALLGSAIVPGIDMDWSAVRWTDYLSIAGSGVISIAAGGVMWSAGVKEIGPSRTGNFGNLIPIVALAVSALAFDEPVTGLQVLGAAMTLVGVAVARR
jgi:drug/metabolite transporter (DMT)-like permease